ncbi:MAG: HlyD family efflux transporter periplasmic adaptor subunit, partial [Caulobacteraceae bacterium]|nr:HlyD family efflux transporter periplasmic adaptor subunit [Caulobacteraceae bacterium]
RLASADAATRLEAEQAATAAAISAGEQRQALAALQSAQARRDLEAYEVTVRDIRAPAAGRIVRRTAAAGAFVSVGSPLFVLEPDGRRVVRAELDEAFADRVKPGMTAAVSREFQPGVSYRAQILRVSNILAAPALADDMTPKADSRVVTVTLVLPDGTDLRIGQKVLVRFSP